MTMPRRGTAHEAKAGRDAARRYREAQIESALADYYHAAALAERIRDTGRRKCEELLADAERTAGPQDAAAAHAVSRLRDLLGGIPETAQLCGLTTTAVRDMLAGQHVVGPPARADRSEGEQA
jgi:hypothetical protein